MLSSMSSIVAPMTGDRDVAEKKAMGARIRSAREAMSFTQVDFGKQCGKDDNTVSRWERGDIAPEALTLGRIGRVANVSLDWLVNGKEPPAPCEVMQEFRESFHGKIVDRYVV